MAICTKSPKEAAAYLKNGQLVAIPTETVYGLAADATNTEAVAQIFAAKNRPAFDPLIVHLAGAEQMEKYAEYIPDAALKLAEAAWPGPLTIVLNKSKLIPDLVTSGHQTVGLRVPNHPLTLALLREISFPVAAPSANPFGFVSPTSAAHVQAQLGEKIPCILDGGNSQVGIESTIVDFSNNQRKVLRLGGMSLEQLQDVLGEQLSVQTSSSNPNAPGMLTAHYNPGKKIVVGKNVAELAAKFSTSNVGILAFTTPVAGVNFANQRVLSPSGNLAEAAQNLFAHLRDFNTIQVDVVLAEWVPNHGLGRAINDRLKRAAAKPNF